MICAIMAEMFLGTFSLLLAFAAQTISDVNGLLDAGDRQASPSFEIRGVISGVTARGNFALMDGTGHSFFHRNSTNALHVGECVIVRGTIRHESYGFIRWLAQEIMPDGSKEIAPPPLVSLHEATGGGFDCQTVRTRGWISDIGADEVDARYILATLTDGDASALIVYPRNRDLRELRDAKVEVTCVSRPNYYGSRVFSPYLLDPCQGDNLKVIEPPPADRFAATSVDVIQHVNPSELARMGRLKATGRVVALWDGKNMLIRTRHRRNPSVIAILDNGASTPTIGEWVQVVGYPETDLFSITLMDALWRPIQKPADASPNILEENPKQMRLQELFSTPEGKRQTQAINNGCLITVEGRVLSIPSPTDASKSLMLEQDGYMASVNLSACSNILTEISIGCTVRLTGLCILQTELWRGGRQRPRAHGFTLIPRSQADVTIVARPPWWTPRRLWATIGILSVSLALILLWNRWLAKCIERRTHRLMRERRSRDLADLKKEERTRLAIELHDTFSQNLTGVALQIDAAELAVTTKPDLALPYLESARRKMQNCRDNLRNCLWDLRSLVLEERELSEAIRLTLAPQIGRTATLKIDGSVPTSRLSDNLVHASLCILRELASNAVHHGKATDISIRCGLAADATLELAIADNGIGFNIENLPGTREGHFGLQGVRERVERFNGTLSIVSKPGGGTTVSIKGMREDI